MEPSSDLERTTKLAVERNHLAVERTFLAWIRTGLAGIGGGFALIRLLHFNSPFHAMVAYAIGVFFMVWGISIFSIGLIEYERAYKRLRRLDTELYIPLGRRRLAIVALIGLSIALFILVI